MSIVPAPKAVSLSILALAGAIYGLFESFSSIAITDSFLVSPYISHKPSVTDVILQTSETQSIDSVSPSSENSTPTVDKPGDQSLSNNSTVISAGSENTTSTQSVSVVVPTNQPSEGISEVTQTKTAAKVLPTTTPVVSSTATVPSKTVKSSTKAPSSSSVVPINKNVSTSVSNKNTVSSSADGKSTKPKSKAVTVKELTKWWQDGKIPTSVQAVNENGENDYDPQEVMERFKNSSWNAIWIKFIDHMVLAKNESKIWQELARDRRSKIVNSAFVENLDPTWGVFRIPLFGTFFLPEHSSINADFVKLRHPHAMEWNGPNIAEACKRFTNWTPRGAWWMFARDDSWNAAWHFCTKPSKYNTNQVPKDWWYPIN